MVKPSIGAAVLLASTAAPRTAPVAVARRRSDDHDALAQAHRRLDRIGQARCPGPGSAGRGRWAPCSVASSACRTSGGRRRPRSCAACTCRASALRRGRIARRPRGRARSPAAARASNTRSPSVLRSRMSGPRTSSRVPSGRSQDPVHDLGHGHALDLVAVGAVGMADAREQQPQVVVHLGHGADGGARVRGWRPSGRWRWPATARRSGRRPASPSGPGTGGHTRTGSRRSAAGLRRRWCRRQGWTCRCPDRPGDDGEPVARHRDGDVLEVVFAGTANDELVLGHPSNFSR